MGGFSLDLFREPLLRWSLHGGQDRGPGDSGSQRKKVYTHSWRAAGAGGDSCSALAAAGHKPK